MRNGYIVYIELGCLLIFALPGESGVPIAAVTHGAMVLGKKAVFDTDLARIYGANFVAGEPQFLSRLRSSEGTARKRLALTDGMPAHITPAMRGWVQNGEVRTSSAAIFYRMTLVSPDQRLRADALKSHPRDLGDLRRCLLLVETVPEFKEAFGKMADVSPEWAALVPAWHGLTASLEFECPNWRKGINAVAERTDRFLRETLAKRMAA